MSPRFVHAEYLLPTASLVACLQALACLSGMEQGFVSTPTGHAMHVALVVVASLIFSSFSWSTLRHRRGFKLAVVSYAFGVAVLATGVHVPQTQTLYRVACNAFGEAEACAAAAESSAKMEWHDAAAKYATRTCTQEAGWRSLDCVNAPQDYRLDPAQQCQVARAACSLGYEQVCETRPTGCELSGHAQSLAESCESGVPSACLELAKAQATPERDADYAVKACVGSGGQIGCRQAISSGLAPQRFQACEAIRRGCHFSRASCQVLVPQCDAILDSPFVP